MYISKFASCIIRRAFFYKWLTVQHKYSFDIISKPTINVNF